MSVANEMNRHALHEHHQHEHERERETLERVQAEALSLERLPEGEEPRGSTFLVDGEEIPQPKRRLTGKLTVRW